MPSIYSDTVKGRGRTSAERGAELREAGGETCSSLARRLGDLEEEGTWKSAFTGNTPEETTVVPHFSDPVSTESVWAGERYSTSREPGPFCMIQADSVKPCCSAP
ncbi:hypothetical protein Q5P01_017522 [Channa striata]|uniref:Uncharacterized protein n=1 Tax=Channa striata TaxID=64152 RepID=A0AA88SJ60_CHASR|nr:hypothetical protein Q5P01_017522 [Channa striata]